MFDMAHDTRSRHLSLLFCKSLVFLFLNWLVLLKIAYHWDFLLLLLNFENRETRILRIPFKQVFIAFKLVYRRHVTKLAPIFLTLYRLLVWVFEVLVLIIYLPLKHHVVCDFANIDSFEKRENLLFIFRVVRDRKYWSKFIFYLTQIWRHIRFRLFELQQQFLNPAGLQQQLLSLIRIRLGAFFTAILLLKFRNRFRLLMKWLLRWRLNLLYYAIWSVLSINGLKCGLLLLNSKFITVCEVVKVI